MLTKEILALIGLLSAIDVGLALDWIGIFIIEKRRSKKHE